MDVFSNIAQLHAYIQNCRKAGMTIGFVPTMGALHIGHKSLITRAKSENDKVICSIFVNPAQFNDKSDYLRYPKTPETDKKLLIAAECDVLYIPIESEIYPGGEVPEMDFGTLETVMEGAHRPGHFKGMAAVVSRFLEIVNPDKAYFGEKDYQQLAIVRVLNARMGNKTEVIGCETIRENDGLAFSSRNTHLTPAERDAAPVIYSALTGAAHSLVHTFVKEALSSAIREIESKGGFKVQYLELVDSETLQPATQVLNGIAYRICVAVLTSQTRLIDNIPVLI